MPPNLSPTVNAITGGQPFLPTIDDSQPNVIKPSLVQTPTLTPGKGGMSQSNLTTPPASPSPSLPPAAASSTKPAKVTQIPPGFDPDVVAMVRAIKQQESGGRSVKGASGEFGMYQFMPATWKAAAQQYLGDPNAPQTPENENYVMYHRVADMKAKGLNPGQIAAVHNAGSSVLKDPNAWFNRIGTNSKGVHYDTPGYVNKVYALYQKYKSELGGTPGNAMAAGNEGAVNASQMNNQRAQAAGHSPFPQKDDRSVEEIIGTAAKETDSGQPGILGKAANIINKGVNAVSDALDYTGLPEIGGAVVGAAGAGVGAVVGGAGQAILNVVKGRPITENVVEKAKEIGKDTAGFGYGVGNQGTKGAIMGGVGGTIPNALMAFGQGYQGLDDLKSAIKSGDYAKGFEGATSLAMGAAGAMGLRHGGTILNPEITGFLSKRYGNAGAAAESAAAASAMTGDLASNATDSGSTSPIKMTPQDTSLFGTLDKINNPKQAIQQKLYPKLFDKAVDNMETTLKLTPSQIKEEADVGKRAAKTIVEEQPTLGKLPGNRLSSHEGALQLKSKATAVTRAVSDVVNDTGKYISMEEYRAKVISDLKNKTNKASGQDYQKTLDYANKEIDALKDNFKDTGIATPDGDLLLPIGDFNFDIKHGRWEKAYANKLTRDQSYGNTDHRMGEVAKHMVEEAVPDAPIRQMNQYIGDLLHAADVLENRHGSILAGGKLGRYMGEIIGGVISHGSSVPTTLLNIAGGGKLAEALQDPRIKIWMINKALDAIGNPAERMSIQQQAEQILANRAKNRANILRLPAPGETSYQEPIFNMPPAGGDTFQVGRSFDTPHPSVASLGPLPDEGRAQNVGFSTPSVPIPEMPQNMPPKLLSVPYQKPVSTPQTPDVIAPLTPIRNRLPARGEIRNYPSGHTIFVPPSDPNTTILGKVLPVNRTAERSLKVDKGALPPIEGKIVEEKPKIKLPPTKKKATKKPGK